MILSKSITAIFKFCLKFKLLFVLSYKTPCTIYAGVCLPVCHFPGVNDVANSKISKKNNNNNKNNINNNCKVLYKQLFQHCWCWCWCWCCRCHIWCLIFLWRLAASSSHLIFITDNIIVLPLQHMMRQLCTCIHLYVCMHM